VPLRPDPSRAAAVLAGLDALRAAVTEAEDDVLACLVVTGEPRPQRVLDDWLDQVADTLRSLGQGAEDLVPATRRYTAPAPERATAAPTPERVTTDPTPERVPAAPTVADTGAGEGDSPAGALGVLGSPSRHDHRDRP